MVVQPITMPNKVALGLSGGVDSSLSAHLLREQGYAVTGVYLECWRAPGCRSEEDRKDALKVALDLGISFQVLDFKQTYKDTVVEYFFSEYQAGRTPNPDVLCNKEIKFGLFYDWAMGQGFDYIATGHYAQIVEEKSRLVLASGVDAHKDQTYFLYLLKPEQLAHVLFPIGHLTKTEVRAEAQKRSIHVADKKDSVGICFIGDINVHSFLQERLGEHPGGVVDTQGNIIGKHQGLWFYTIGQRHGFTIDSVTLVNQSDGSSVNRHNIPPFYVIAKKPTSNQLVVGFGAETFCADFKVRDFHSLANPTVGITDATLGDLDQLEVRIRHTGELIPCKLTVNSNAELAVTLSHPVKGVAEGQSAVFYRASEGNPEVQICLGGGVISLDSL